MISRICDACVQEFFVRVPSEKKRFCNSKCWASVNPRLKLNAELARSPAVRAKMSATQRAKPSAGKTYRKLYGRHEHRVVAEQMLGRALLPGEVVHHIDENRRNNDPSNLMVFPNQAEHARHHGMLRREAKRAALSVPEDGR